MKQWSEHAEQPPAGNHFQQSRLVAPATPLSLTSRTEKNACRVPENSINDPRSAFNNWVEDQWIT